MKHFLLEFVLLAQGEGNGGGAGEVGIRDVLANPLFLIIILFALFYFLIIRPQRREQSRRQEMLSALKKNDRVVTIGGIIGSVANLSQDGKEVTVKVDDNTRLKMLRSSIQNVLKDDESEQKEKS